MTMPISVELAVLATFTPLSPKFVFHGYCFLRPRKLFKRLRCDTRRFVRIRMVSEVKNPSSSSSSSSSSSLETNRDSKVEDEEELWRESEFVEVIGIGSRKDSVLDFCLDSPLQSSSALRFWNIVTKESKKVQLQQRFLQRERTRKLVDASLFPQSYPKPKAIILVASAAYGSEHVTAMDMLKTIRSANGLVVTIILRPFSFEGKRRHDEVKDLLRKLQEHANICIDIDADALLKKDLVTLNEALKTANGAVLLAINSISVLISETQRKLLDAPQNSLKELHVSEAIKILERYKEAKVGFGSGYSIKSSISQAIFDCPFIGTGLKDFNGIVMCTIASSAVIKDGDLHAFLHTFRQTTEYMKELIMSTVHEPNLEPNLLVTTVVIAGCVEQKTAQKSTVFSRLGQRFPFVFNLLRAKHQQSDETQEGTVHGNASASEVTNSPYSGEMANKVAEESNTEAFDNFLEEFSRVLSSSDDDINASCVESIQSEGASSEAKIESSNFCDQLTKGTPALHRDYVNGLKLGPADQIAQDWAKERAADSRGSSIHNNLSIFCLPVGVRPSEDLNSSVNVSHNTVYQEPKTGDYVKVQPLTKLSMPSWAGFTGMGLEAIRGFCDTASGVTKKKPNDVPKKQGVLSARAASMLEAERDTPKKWNPVVEMQYRGGVYKGRCQGGLPEGKGRLILGDGSIYDGTWHYGTRSGLGTFYFSNGDVFQGSWRDDVIHGKGWFYFHTGDRWFANFWKGKANGEGRFYSKSGDVFFGHFQDGWRHGRFLCIDVHGARFVEIWNEGILVSRNELESDTGVR